MRLFRQGMPAFVAAWEAHDPRMPPEMRERWLALDAAAIAAAWEAMRCFNPGLADVLPNIRTPTLIYYGTDEFPDALPERAAEQLPDATVVALEGLNHAQTFRRSDLVLPHARVFLDRVSGPDRG